MPTTEPSAKLSSESRVTMMHWALPEETNSAGYVFGGKLLEHIDKAGVICASRHARMKVTTAGIERMEFIAPASAGRILLFHASVNIVAHSSMEIGVLVEEEHPETGDCKRIALCYLTFVGLNDEGRPVELPQLLPETEKDRRRMGDAARRMALGRMERRLSGGEGNYFHLFIEQEECALCFFPTGALVPDVPEGMFGIRTSDGGGTSLLASSIFLQPFAATGKAELKEYYACIRLLGPVYKVMGNFLPMVSSLLEAGEIAALAMTASHTEYLFVPLSTLAKAVELLRLAGHRVER